jgi:hypothetical protein
VAAFIISNLNYVENQTQYPKENGEEKHECLQVIKDLLQHRNHLCHVLKQPHVEKGFEEHEESQNDHARFSDNHQGFARVIREMHQNVGKSTPHMHLVKVVPGISQVFRNALFCKLSHVIHERIKQTEKVKDLQWIFEKRHIIRVDVFRHNKHAENAKIADMREEPNRMDISAVGIPLELQEIHESLCIEDPKLFSIAANFD